jgi:integrase
VKRKSVKFYDPAACQILLNTVPDKLYYYLVLGLICGIRPNELMRLKSQHIRVDGDGILIRLDADVTKKTRRRVIELWPGDLLGDMALAWLRIKPIPERVFDGNMSTFRRHICAWQKILNEKHGVKWIPDGLRHTAASMHYAQNRDIVKTAALLGDQVRVVEEHYKGLATQAEARAFYAFRPSESHGDSTAIEISESAAGVSA